MAVIVFPGTDDLRIFAVSFVVLRIDEDIQKKCCRFMYEEERKAQVVQIIWKAPVIGNPNDISGSRPLYWALHQNSSETTLWKGKGSGRCFQYQRVAWLIVFLSLFVLAAEHRRAILGLYVDVHLR